MADLQVAVVGAGIAGLTAAASLARDGVACEVFEQAGELSPAGAGIQLSPNATRLLHRLGLAERLAAVAVRPAAIELRHWHSGNPIAVTELGDACQNRYGAPYYTLHRADLHAALLDLVESSRAVTLRLSHRCVGVIEHPDRVKVHFADHPDASADLVIGADGIHSAVRGVLVAADEVRYSGVSVYRGLVPTARVGHLAGARVLIWLGPGQHCVCYPVSSGALMSFVAAVPDRPAGRPRPPDSGDLAELRAVYAGWHPDVLGLLGAADSVTRWALHDLAPLARLSAGRVAVIGDAAHAMLPFGAQGANQAIEAAVTLAACLRGAPATQVPAALAHYERVRLPRLARVGATVRRNARDHHLGDGRSQRRRDRAMTANRSLRRQGWLYGYDAERATAALAHS